MSVSSQNMRIANICLFLESRWNTEIAYQCESCLEYAYFCTITCRDGYVSDEDLAATSRRHMKLKKKNMNVYKALK